GNPVPCGRSTLTSFATGRPRSVITISPPFFTSARRADRFRFASLTPTTRMTQVCSLAPTHSRMLRAPRRRFWRHHSDTVSSGHRDHALPSDDVVECRSLAGPHGAGRRPLHGSVRARRGPVRDAAQAGGPAPRLGGPRGG